MSLRSKLNPKGSNIDERLETARLEHGMSTEVSKDDRLARAKGAAVVALLSAGSLVASNAVRSAEDGPRMPEPTSTTEVVAQPGDDVWSLQRAEATGSGVHPDTDIREEIDQAVELNGGPTVQTGERVTLVEFPNQPGSPQAIAEQQPPVTPVPTQDSNK